MHTFISLYYRTLFPFISFLSFLGTPPKESSFAFHATLVNHFMSGAFYPVGGASEIAMHLIPVIEKSGGCVLVRATVKQILINEEKGKAIGTVCFIVKQYFISIYVNI